MKKERKKASKKEKTPNEWTGVGSWIEKRKRDNVQPAGRPLLFSSSNKRTSINPFRFPFFLSSRLSVCVCHEAKQSSKPVGVANLEAIDGVEEEGNKRSAGGAAQHSTALGFMGF